MLDFLMISTRMPRKDVVEIYPKFIIKRSSDLMIRGGDFYAIWVEERGLWSTDEQDVIMLVDRELKKFYEEHKDKYGGHVTVKYMWDAETGIIDAWHKYCQKQMRDHFHPLDENLIFGNKVTTKKDYASRKLHYPLEAGDISAWDKLISTLYSPAERHKIEWAIGAIVSGDAKKIQKFMVLYGAAGTGKSTILNIIQQLFEGYYSVFDARALGSSSNAFALEAFKNNPLVAIQHDGDLSRIEDNTRINSLVSHEYMTVNEKFKASYVNRFNAFLFMGTNKPVKITDAKSGLIRRLIDVSPSGNKLSSSEYKRTFKQVSFELGAIAHHCLSVYTDNPGAYDNYIPISMMGASNDFYNFILDSYDIFTRENSTTLKAAWEMYKVYVEEAKVPYQSSRRVFKEELKNYFCEYHDRYILDDGTRVRSYFLGFKTDQFEDEEDKVVIKPPVTDILQFNSKVSLFDKECADCIAQKASKHETPCKPWDEVTTKLSDLDTSKLHYVKIPENHIVIDFDIPDENGNKDYEKNLAEASKWPPTYAELSKSGAGIHLHYIYTGDVSKLSRVYDDHIEVKVFSGKSALRRKLTKCNNLPIATISSGLPLKGDKNMVNFETIKSEKWLRAMIKRNLNKEIHPATKPSIDFIGHLLDKAYEEGLKYDVSDLYDPVLAFAMDSTNQSEYCTKRVDAMKFKSEEPSLNRTDIPDDTPIVFFDIECFPNLFLVNWKFRGKGKPVVRMINPKPVEIEELLKFKLIGFNNRGYDNHMLWGCLMGYNNEQLFELSKRLVSDDKDISKKAKFSEAFNLSYTDVYDFASAQNKMSLKKWEIELGIHHQELGLPWDQPVPKALWPKVAEYCDNDVLATEEVFDHLSGDWTARQILADLAGLTVNDTTNTLTGKIIFGNNKHPQDEFRWRNLAEPVGKVDDEMREFIKEYDILPMPFDDKSDLPYFPGYKYEYGVSTYRGEVVGEGGYVYAEPGIHGNVALIDVTSMHPHSALAEMLFGPKFTRAFHEIVYGRVHIKHEAWDLVNQMLDGKLTPYIQKVIDGEMTAKELADALKTAINSVYGLTSAKFDNLFKDRRNIDNIVAKRGALFMIDLKYAVQEKGYTVAHIKTDSIKIADATPAIIQFVMDFGRRYGYSFEHEATYDKMCLVNDAVYIANYGDAQVYQDRYGYTPGDNKKHNKEWTATGKQFQVPYIFKTLFSGEPIEFEDLCETMSVKTALYLDMNEALPDVSEFEAILQDRDIVRTKGTDNISGKRLRRLDEYSSYTDQMLVDEIANGHDYHFVGRVGNFCPIKPGCGGGVLYRENKERDIRGNTKYAAATGSKGYRWRESELVKGVNENDIDRSYHNALVDDAIKTIAKYGDVEWFISDEPYEGSLLQISNEVPWK